MINFFHKWREPHCIECANELRCQNCDTLRELLEAERYNNKQLLQAILEHTNPKSVQASNEEIKLPIDRKNIPWRVRQQMLEQEDRKKLELLRQKSEEQIENMKSTEVLEKELGIGEEDAG